jgi:hypothetical protein
MPGQQRGEGFAAAFGSTPPCLASSAIFIQSWLPMVPPAAMAIFAGSRRKPSSRSRRVLYGESARTATMP